jgi:hypothetical protein
VIGLLAFGLSLGPTASGLAPLDLARHVPGLALFRAPARFGLLVVLATAALAAVGAAWLARGRAGRIAVCCCLPLMLLEWRVVDFPGGKPAARPTPAAYARLRDLPAGAIVSLPDYAGTDQWFREADYLLFSTDHWRPIANGYGRSEPPGFRPLMDALRTFPSAASMTALRANRIRYVLWDAARAGDAPEDLRRRAMAAGGLRLVEPVETILLFEVVDAP